MFPRSAFFSFLTCLAVLMGATARSAPPQAGDQEHTDSYGDPLPEGALTRLGTVRLRTGGFRGSLLFSADGKILVAASNNGMVHYWEATTGKPLRRFRTLSWAAVDIKLSPDGKLVAATAMLAPTTIGMWETATGKLVRRLEVPAGGKAVRLAFSPDGKSLVSGGGPDNKVCFWEVSTGRLLRQLPATPRLTVLGFSPDGKTLVTKTPGWVYLCDPASGEERRRFQAPTSNTPDFAFSPDSKILATTLRINGIELWDPSTGEKLGQMLAEAPYHAVALAFSADGKTLAAASFTTIRFWNVSTRKEISHTAEPGLWVGSLRFSPDGKIVASQSSSDTAIRLWDVATGKELHQHLGHRSAVSRVVFSPDGALAATHSNDAAVRVWRVSTGKQQQMLLVDSKSLAAAVTTLCFAPDGKAVIFADHEGIISIRDALNGKEMRRIAPKGDAIHLSELSLSPDGKTLTALATATTRKGRIQRSVLSLAWDLATGEEIRRRQEPMGRMRPWRLSPDGKVRASYNDGPLVNVCNVETGAEIVTLDGRCEGVWPVAVSPDSRLLAGVCHHGKAKEGIDDYLSSIAFWELATGAEIRRIKLKPGSPQIAIAFSPDGRILASGGDESIGLRLWDLTTGKELHRYADPGAQVSSLSFGASGHRLASGLANGTTLLWDAGAFIPRAGPQPRRLPPSDLDRLWSDLSAKDAGKAHLALWTLAAAREQAVAFLCDRLPLAKIDAQRIRRLIGDLDSDQFAVREAATQALEQLGQEAEPELRKARAPKLSAELRKRIDALLAAPRIVRSLEVARQIRAVQVLEWIGSSQARRHLETLAGGEPAARLTQEAKAALQRQAGPQRKNAR